MPLFLKILSVFGQIVRWGVFLVFTFVFFAFDFSSIIDEFLELNAAGRLGEIPVENAVLGFMLFSIYLTCLWRIGSVFWGVVRRASG